MQESGGELCVWLFGNTPVTGGIPAEETGKCCYPKHSLLLLADSSGTIKCLISVYHVEAQGDNTFFPLGMVEPLMNSAVSILMNVLDNAHSRSFTLLAWIICHFVQLC